MRKAKLARIILNERTPEQTIFLRDEDTGKLIPIVIGIFEANAIQMGLYKIPTERPMTHDLVSDMLHALGAKLTRVDITRLENGTFYADLHLATEDGLKKVDARPSDAIAFATRFGLPLYVSEEVFEASAIDDRHSDDELDDDLEGLI
ncbi:MAG: bifunctional nuclease family protein [Planctomycetota bacterium]|nr:bifunctional nuclease family protein [Planctomycetota bacterium]